VEIELAPGANGVFDVSADGELIFSRHEAGRFPEHAEVLARLRD
jgi:selenoprotein W-related protein